MQPSHQQQYPERKPNQLTREQLAKNTQSAMDSPWPPSAPAGCACDNVSLFTTFMTVFLKDNHIFPSSSSPILEPQQPGGWEANKQTRVFPKKPTNSEFAQDQVSGIAERPWKAKRRGSKRKESARPSLARSALVTLTPETKSAPQVLRGVQIRGNRFRKTKEERSFMKPA